MSVSEPRGALGTPHLHLRVIDSTNTRARTLAAAGAPHGTLVTAGEQQAGRGRQGRTWSAPAGRALLSSLVLRDPPRLLPLLAGVAVAEVADRTGAPAQLKWPNDVLLDGRKVAGILVEGRPQERWAVLGIGLNVALRPVDFPPELRDTAATLGLESESAPGHAGDVAGGPGALARAATGGGARCRAPARCAPGPAGHLVGGSRASPTESTGTDGW